MSEECRREIERLHEFFEGWFGGRLTESSISRVTEALGAEFVMVGPSGKILDRDSTLQGIRLDYGSRPGLHIWIENTTIRAAWAGFAVTTYEEWQELNGERTARFSTAILRERHEAPEGWEWLYLHEEWMEPAPDSPSA